MVDGTQMYHDALRRITELGKLNAALAAEIDRCRPVVEAAVKVSRDWTSEKGLMNADDGELAATDHVHLNELQVALAAYEAAQEQG